MVAYEQISHSRKHAPHQQRNPMILVIGSQGYVYTLQRHVFAVLQFGSRAVRSAQYVKHYITKVGPSTEDRAGNKHQVVSVFR